MSNLTQSPQRRKQTQLDLCYHAPDEESSETELLIDHAFDVLFEAVLKRMAHEKTV